MSDSKNSISKTNELLRAAYLYLAAARNYYEKPIERKLAAECKDEYSKNGIRVVTLFVPGKPNVDIVIGVGAGWGDESSSDKPGVAHFLEHVASKGSFAKNGDKYEPRMFERKIFKNNGAIDAGTYSDYTLYDAHVSLSDYKEVLTYLCSIVCRPELNEAQIESEKKIILNEWLLKRLEDIERIRKHSDSIREDKLIHATKHPVVGTMQSVASMNQLDIKFFREAHYTKDNVIVVVEGDVDHNDIVKQIENEFSLPDTPSLRTGSAWAPAHRVKPDEYPRGKWVALMFRTEDQNNPELNVKIDYDKLSNILGNLSDSILRRTLRDSRSLTYRVECKNESNNNCLIIAFSAFSEDIDTCRQLILQDLYELGGDNDQPKEIKTAVNRMLRQKEIIQCLGDDKTVSTIENVEKISSYQAPTRSSVTHEPAPPNGANPT